MLFNSIDFALFLPIVFGLYWFVFQKKLSQQNLLLLIASYTFYGWWDWRFLSLIIFSSGVDYLVAQALGKQDNKVKRKWLLATSLFVNIGFLGFFKYYNFFADSFASAFTILDQSFEPSRLTIILPIGISFYTFQTMSYTIDVYRRKIRPEKNVISFFAFVSFFPQLVAGPIERAKDLLPQFNNRRVLVYEKAADGLRQILWGLCKKMLVADQCAIFVNEVFESHAEHNGLTLLFAAILFAVQIYCDFSGYSDIAIGTARLFGFNLTQNFAFPFFSRDIAEFWRRWHISLFNWCKDYIYIPLGGSRKGKKKQMLFVLIAYGTLGLWHGANFTFILFGLLHGLAYIFLVLINNQKKTSIVAERRILPSFKEFLQMLSTFLFFVLTLVLFRSDSVTSALVYYENMFSADFFVLPESIPKKAPFFALTCIAIEWFQRDKQHALEIINTKQSSFIRYVIYYFLIYIILLYGVNQKAFVYFQF